MLLVWIGLIIASLFGVIVGAASDNPLTVIGSVLALVFSIIMLAGVFTVQPNQAVALLLFGKYVGTTRANGLRWANPFYSKKKVSLRVRNFETDKLKVNELDGSPIEIAAVVVWQVVDSAEALFAVDDYVNFVHIQSEAALRQMATAYPYDGSTPEEIALRSHANEISERLMAEIQDRLEAAGVKVIETRISHLAYAAEIASAMLQRQQATAVVAAREKIVEGAVGMVEHALAQLSEREILELDPERRANMVSNLLVVLCGDRNAQPVLNTGTLY
ncbi:MAG: SPFH domain-containing protein [Maricaulaceae bacterium]